MSEAPKLTKKQKKAAAFRDRKGKGKVKVQTDEDALDVPVEEAQDLAELADDHLPTTIPPSKAESKGKSSAVVEDATNAAITALQPSKKRKRTEADVALERADQIAQEVQPKGSKRRRQKKAEDSTEGGEKVGEGPSDSTDGRRLILFLGNLKYTTSRELIAEHFSSCASPPDIRLLTPKAKPGSKPSPSIKSKGCAFLEFHDRLSLQQGLKLHHTVLDGRQINVELTAGGGGKSEARVTKLKERNKELHTQRTKNAEKQKKKGEIADVDDIATLTAGKRYSATSGVEQAPVVKRTWTVGDEAEDATHRGGVKHAKKRGPKKSVRSMASGMNAIPVG